MLLRFARHQFITVQDLQLHPHTGDLYAKIDFREFEPLKNMTHDEIEWELREAGVFGDNTAVTIFGDVLVLQFMDSTAGNLFMERFNKYIMDKTPERYRPDSIERGDPIADTHQTDLDALIDAWKATDDPDEKARLEAMMNIKSRSKLQGKSMRFASELELVDAWPGDDVHLYYGKSIGDHYVVMSFGFYKVVVNDENEVQFELFGSRGLFDPDETGINPNVLQEIEMIVAPRWHGGDPALED